MKRGNIVFIEPIKGVKISTESLEYLVGGISLLSYSNFVTIWPGLQRAINTVLCGTSLANTFAEYKIGPISGSPTFPDEKKDPIHRIIRVADPGLQFLVAATLFFSEMSGDDKLIQQGLMLFNTLLISRALFGVAYGRKSHLFAGITGAVSNFLGVNRTFLGISGILNIFQGAKQVRVEFKEDADNSVEIKIGKGSRLHESRARARPPQSGAARRFQARTRLGR